MKSSLFPVVLAALLGISTVLLTTTQAASFRKIETYTDKLPKDSNAIGESIAGVIRKLVADLGDPWVVLEEDLAVPVEIVNGPISIKGDARIGNVTIAGLTGLNITNSVATLVPLAGDFGFHLPELELYADYAINMVADIGGLLPEPLPITGSGPITLKLVETQLDTRVAIRIKLNGHLELTSLTYALDVFGLVFRIEGLLSELNEELNEAVNMLVNAYGAILVNMFEAQYHDNITELVTDVANSVLANLTLADIIGIIGGGGAGVQEYQLLSDEVVLPTYPNLAHFHR